jgi:hypothetical protein
MVFLASAFFLAKSFSNFSFRSSSAFLFSSSFKIFNSARRFFKESCCFATLLNSS